MTFTDTYTIVSMTYEAAQDALFVKAYLSESDILDSCDRPEDSWSVVRIEMNFSLRTSSITCDFFGDAPCSQPARILHGFALSFELAYGALDHTASPADVRMKTFKA